MAQTTITHFFSKRKRTAEDTKNKAKVVILDSVNSSKISSPLPLFKESQISESVQSEQSQKLLPLVVNRRVVSSDSHVLGADANSVHKPKISKTTSKGKPGSKDWKAVANCDIRGARTQKLPCADLEEPLPASQTAGQESPSKVDEETASTNACKNTVPFELRGPLSPEKRKRSHFIQNEPVAESSSLALSSPEEENGNEEISQGLTTPVKKNVMSTNKDLPLAEIQAKISRSAKLAELQKSLAKFSKGANKLKEIEERKQQLERPQIQKFEAIELEIPISPQKSVYSSPQKIIYNSPQKICSTPQKDYSSLRSTPSKSPAYKRFASLAQPVTTALTLPYSYRCLAEIFRAVDTVASMMYNRKEIITFKKLKPAVQEMLRRNFTEKHLGQIRKVLPSAYDFKQEKVKSFGRSAKNDDYDLTLTPLVVETKQDNSKNSNFPSEKSTSKYVSMTPSVLLERRQAFHKSLLEKTKDYHEEFLRNQDPPLNIPRENLTRWHPDFEVDLVPEIECEQLPQAPNSDKFSSAKDVLERAKNIFSYNSRLCNALETLNEENSSKTKAQPTETASSSAPSSTPSILKGIPKALLEKVRARQAAKAMEAMTRTTAADREAICFMRLPEIARILRNVFVTEKKNVLCLEVALEKLGNSYREKLTLGELKEHIELLIKTVPGWLTVHTIRKTDFLKLSKNGDVNSVIKKLEEIAAEKNCR